MALSLTTPIGFAWVDSTETTFDETHERVDENIFDFSILHEEGQIPTLTLTIRTPRNGLGVVSGFLAPGRKQWAWLSWYNPATELAEPLFFGRLVAVPDGFSGGELLTFQFVARSNDWISRKQTLADTLKVRPYYDPIFLDDKSRNDPDAILEGYSAAYHVDRTTLAWTISDILEGEDGTVAFDGDDVLYESLKLDVAAIPIKQVRVDAKVNWTQTLIGGGSLFVGAWTVETYTGGSLISSWPKPGTDLGGGWKAGPMTGAVDIGNIEYLEPYTESGSFSDQNTKHNEGDTISGSWNYTIPRAPYGGITVAIKASADFGNIGGSTENPDGSSSSQSSWTYIPLWKVFCQLDLVVDSSTANPFTENMTFTLSADLQPVLQDSDTQEETEVIDISSIDVGSAIFDYKAWSSVASTAVTVGQVMLPNIPVGPGGLSFQICIVAGTCGAIPPLFSDTIGTTTVDGTATWACVGGSLPTIQDWQTGAYTRAGTVISVPSAGGYFFLAFNSGYTGILPPTNPFYGSLTVDGGVTWISLGLGGPSLTIPIGGAPGNITQTAFFGQDRGAWAIEYLIEKASAVIKKAARAIEISFQVPFEQGVGLSCRKNASITCKDIPGGTAVGKIISYSLSASGETGEFICDIKIGCAVGEGGSVTPAAGEPVYVDDDYVGSDYQQYTGEVIDLGDVGYTPPPADVASGSANPLAYGAAVLSASWNGSTETQRRAIQRAFQLQEFEDFYKEIGTGGEYSGSSRAARAAADNLVAAGKSATDFLALPENSIYFDITLKPITGLQYDTPYTVDVTELYIPKQIDLGAV